AAPPHLRAAFSFENRQRHGLQRRQLREQLVDLEGAGEAAVHALVRPQRSYFGGVCPISQKDLPRIRPQHPGHQVDERGLAGAVRPDQRVTHAPRQREVDVLRYHERPEPLVQFVLFLMLQRPPRRPFGMNITTATSSRPIQKYQYCGLTPENWSRATM